MAAINAINTVWTLVAAFLVFGMQVGFVLLEAGFARSRESVNILVEGIADTCICGVTFWLWGFAFMFEPGNGFIGLHGFALQGLPATYGATGVALLAFWVFQFAFADTCSTSHRAMIGRCGFVGDLLYSVGVTGFIYPISDTGRGVRTDGSRNGTDYVPRFAVPRWCTRLVGDLTGWGNRTRAAPGSSIKPDSGGPMPARSHHRSPGAVCGLAGTASTPAARFPPSTLAASDACPSTRRSPPARPD
jgi:hypothetical protein